MPHDTAASTAHRAAVVLEMPRTKNVPRRSEGDAAPEQQPAAAALAAPAPAPAPAPHHDALQVGGAGAPRVTVKREDEEEQEEEEETSQGQQRDLLALMPDPARVLPSGTHAAHAADPGPALLNDAPPGGRGRRPLG